MLIKTVIWAVLLPTLLAQVFKVARDSMRKGRLSWEKILETGGMPSSHTAAVMGLVTSVGLIYGFLSIFFVISVVFAAIVIRDAVGIRFAAGNHARVINHILQRMGPEAPDRPELEEHLGHHPREVAGGALLGILTALILHYLL